MARTDNAPARLLPRLHVILLLAAALLITGAVANFLYLQQQLERRAGLEALAFDVRNFYENVAQSARSASQGLEPDRSALFAMQDNYEDLILLLEEGDPARDVPALPERHEALIPDLKNAWERVAPTVEAIIAGLPTAQRTKVNAATIATLVEDLRAPADALLESTAGSTGRDTALLRARLEQLDALGSLASRIIRLDATAQRIAPQLKATMAQVQSLHGGLAKRIPDGLQEEYDALEGALEELGSNVQALVEAAPTLERFNNASLDFYNRATSIETAAGAIENALLQDLRGEQPSALPSYAMGAAAVLAIVLFIGLFIYQLRREARIATERDRRQQDAILTLLDEITNLADGDLTVGVTVTEDFTGAIADSINFTVENMRGLVGQINAASQQIAEAAEQTQSSVEQMSQRSEDQARETDQATQTITRVSQSLEETAGRATEASRQAQESVRVAHTGAQTVDRTIEGMNTLREQIQDTSKRMKRLGESSQEIGKRLPASRKSAMKKMVAFDMASNGSCQCVRASREIHQ